MSVSIESSLFGMPRLFVLVAPVAPKTVNELKLLSVPVPRTVLSTVNSKF